MALYAGHTTAMRKFAEVERKSTLGVVRQSVEHVQGIQVAENHRLIDICKAYVELTKPRIALFIVFTGYCAMIMATGHIPSLFQTFVAMGGLALSAGGGAAMNMWFDRDIDAIMSRTISRPIPSGKVKPLYALLLGILLGVLSTAILAIFINPLTAMLSLAGYVYYVVIYTMWLKRRTPQNIVIGGGAGAFPPLVGWASATGHLAWPAWVMFGIIFLWTPAHFWGLALYKNADYVKANVPMMPVVRGQRYTHWQMVIYTIGLVFVSLPLALFLKAGWLYLVVACLSGIAFLAINVILLLRPKENQVWAKRTFLTSLAYLPVVFAFIVIGSLV